jgi:hypothetical protein
LAPATALSGITLTASTRAAKLLFTFSPGKRFHLKVTMLAENINLLLCLDGNGCRDAD